MRNEDIFILRWGQPDFVREFVQRQESRDYVAGAFIGSGTMLVAPVSVGAEATIGAGSTITKSAPAGKLTVERGRQQTIDNWKRPEKKSE